MHAIHRYLDAAPQIYEICAAIPIRAAAGDVVLAGNVLIWPFAVLRGGMNCIRVGRNSNIQDHVMLHVSHKTAHKPDGSPLLIGEDCTSATMLPCMVVTSATVCRWVWAALYWMMR